MGLPQQIARKLELVVFNERASDGDSLGFEKGVGHRAANQHRISNAQQVLDDFNLVGNFRAAENGDEWPLRAGQDLSAGTEVRAPSASRPRIALHNG